MRAWVPVPAMTCLFSCISHSVVCACKQGHERGRRNKDRGGGGHIGPTKSSAGAEWGPHSLCQGASQAGLAGKTSGPYTQGCHLCPRHQATHLAPQCDVLSCGGILQPCGLACNCWLLSTLVAPTSCLTSHLLCSLPPVQLPCNVVSRSCSSAAAMACSLASDFALGSHS